MTDQALDPAGTTTVPAGSRASGLLVAAGIGLLLAVLVKALLLESWFVPNGAMVPVLAAGDRVLVLKTGEPRPGDIVVADVSEAFPGPDRATHEDDGLVGRVLAAVADGVGVTNGSRSVAARVVATGGSTVTCCTDGQVLVDGAPVGPAPSAEPFEVAVPPGSVWLLAERPHLALDSLSVVDAEGHGLVPVDAVVGRVVLRFWPLGAVGSPAAGVRS
jgi:signal peptidase I